ncbi:MAG: hypothetical protein FWF86_01390, partial [Clostridia bacterium]|nr:hypothetical protein [Clostridia bacterium]
WMVAASLKDDAQELPSLDIPFGPLAANQCLDTTQWIAAEGGDGKPRYDAVSREPLRLVMARSAQSGLAGSVEALLREGLASIGAELQVENLPFEELLAQYYHQQERTADIYFLASEFPAPFNPFDTFAEGDFLRGYHDSTSLRDAMLVADAQAVLHAGFENRAGYMTAWLAFQRRFMEILPMIPLYSGAYHDFYTADLTDYNVAAYGSWARAIVSAYLK